MAETKVVVKQDPNEVVVAEVLATAIRDIAVGLKRWTAAGMKRRALIVLLNDLSKVGVKNIEYVLNSIEALEDEYCIQKPNK